MVKRTVKYYRPDHGQTADDAFECESNGLEDYPELIAGDCADDYHHNHDGWEASWPIEFVIISESGDNLGTFSVDRESVPRFSARRTDGDSLEEQ